MNNNSNNLFYLTLILVLSFALHRYFRCKNIKIETKNEGSRPNITRRQLYHTALWGTRRLLIVLALLAILLATACISGRISLISTIISFALVAGFYVIIYFPRLQAMCAPLAHLRQIPGFDEMFAGKQLYWLNGAWGYADDEWFIRVGAEHSVALRSSDIDFSKPVRKMVFVWHTPQFKGSGGKKYEICQLRFTGRDGKTISACTWADTNIVNWIKKHGGKLAQ